MKEERRKTTANSRKLTAMPTATVLSVRFCASRLSTGTGIKT